MIFQIINEKDLDMYYQNYFSLTKDQNIQTYLNINGSVHINKALFAQKTIVPGLIKTHK